MNEKKFTLDFLGTTYTGLYIKSPVIAEVAVQDMLSNNGSFGIDIETQPRPKYLRNTKAGLSPHLGSPRLVQIFDSTSLLLYVFDINTVPFEILIPLIEAKTFIAHNALFELKFFKHFGVKTCNINCSFLAAKLLTHATRPNDSGVVLGLGGLVEQLFKVSLPKEMQISNWAEPELTFEQVKYAALDSLTTFLLMDKLSYGLRKLGMERIYKLSRDVQHPIAEMELEGIGFDRESHKKMIETWRVELFKARKELIRLTGVDAVTGHKISDWLQKNLDAQTLALWPKTTSKKLSTASETMLNYEHLDIVAPFAIYQKQEKLISTYGPKLADFINPESRRIHGSFIIQGTRTGRFSARDPNMQNGPRDRGFRNLFVAKEDSTLICADYSQIELRVAAEISRDEEMLGAYRNGIDLHALTASKVSGKPLSHVSKQDRQMAKACFSGDTEILTKKGWVKFEEYNGKDAVAQVTFNTPFGTKYDGNAIIEFVAPLGFRKFKNKKLVSLIDRNIDLQCTPDHEIVFIDNQGRLRKQRMDTAPIKYIPAWGIYNHKETVSDSITRMLVMVQADGCLRCNGSCVRFQFQKQRKIERCKFLLQELNIDFTEQVTEKFTVIYARGLKYFCLDWMTDKKEINWRWLHELSGRIILDELRYWDGETQSWGERDRVKYRSTVFSTIEILQTIACVNNAHATIVNQQLTGYGNTPCWTLSIRLKGFNGHRISETKTFRTKKCTVYCVQVPSSNILIKRQKKVMISGNCNFGFLFGLGASKFSEYAKKSYKVDVSPQQAEDAVQSFRETYSGYRQWQLEQASDGEHSLMAQTICGKKRKLESDNTYGTSMNTPVQGSAAECMMYSLVRLEKALKPYNAKLIATVHDEVLIETSKKDVDIVKQIVNDEMTNGFLDVFPNGITRGLVEAKIGDAWGDAK